MRKKTARFNHRKFHLLPLLRKRRASLDETDWIMLEAEVTTESSPKPRNFRFPVAWMIRILGFACLCVSIPLVAKRIHSEVFYQNEEFVLRELNIRTDGLVSVETLAEVANVSVGMSLMELDLDMIRARIEKLPIVEEAIVSREMPDKLNVMVKERVPIAWLSCPPLGVRPGDQERGYLLDAKGVLFRCLDLTDRVSELPVIETFKMEEPEEGRTLTVAGASSALELLQSSEILAEFEGADPRTIRLRSEWSLQCNYRSGLEVTFSLLETKRGLEDLRTILSNTKDIGATLATVNVAARDNIPVTFADTLTPDAILSVEKTLKDSRMNKISPPESNKEKHLRSILQGG